MMCGIIYNCMFSSMKLAPNTPMGKEESKKIKTIIQFILDKPESYEFQSPVDWKGNSPPKQPLASPTTPSSSKTRWTSAPPAKNCALRSTVSWRRRWTTSSWSGTIAKTITTPTPYAHIYPVDLQAGRKSVAHLQENGQELPPQHPHHCPRQ